MSGHETEAVIAESLSAATQEKSVYESRVEEYEASKDSWDSHAKRIRYADALLHLGEAHKATKELIETELMFPDAYINAIYLGLACELAADLKTARYWIAQGIERNPDGRGGSQWLHLAMVEARLALVKDPDWLRKHSVLEKNTHRTAEEILSAIKIQLAVRGDFGLPPDAVVCDLYFEAGICAPDLASRREYFSDSLELGSLRRPDIERHEQIRALGRASVQAH
jgi:hypothetical protein